jgi:hypothetical protein
MVKPIRRTAADRKVWSIEQLPFDMNIGTVFAFYPTGKQRDCHFGDRGAPSLIRVVVEKTLTNKAAKCPGVN